MIKNKIGNITALALLTSLVLSGCAKEAEYNDSRDGAIGFTIVEDVQSSEVKSVSNVDAKFQGESIILSDKTGKISISLTQETSEGTGYSTFVPSTKGMLINTTKDNNKLLSEYSALVNSFNVTAYNAYGTTVMSDQLVEWSDNEWSYSPVVFWPEGSSLTFYANSNLPESGSAVAVKASGQTLTHAVIEKAEEQKDIMLGFYEGDGDDTGKAAIRFEHPLTAVQFVGDTYGLIAIKSISLSGLASNGTVTFASGVVGDWSVSDDAYTFTSTLGNGENPLPIDETTKIIGKTDTDDGAFILIPQNLSAHMVKLTAIVTTIDGDITVEAKIKTDKWEAGKTNTYTMHYVANNVIPGRFSISPTEKVYFSSGNLWYGVAEGDSAADYHFEDNQYVLRKGDGGRDDNHVSHFWWTNDRLNAPKKNFDGYTGTTFFATDGGAIKGWTVLSAGGTHENPAAGWTYLLFGRTVNGGKSYDHSFSAFMRPDITIEGNKYHGVFIYPDDYTGPLMGTAGASDTWQEIFDAGIVFLRACGTNAGYWDGGGYSNIYG